MARKHDDDKPTGFIASPEYRYWPEKGPDGQDVVMITNKIYPDSIVPKPFLERLLEDGLVRHAPKPKGDEEPAQIDEPVTVNREEI